MTQPFKQQFYTLPDRSGRIRGTTRPSIGSLHDWLLNTPVER